MADPLETQTFKVGGITCMDCITHIAREVQKVPGAAKVSGNLTQRVVRVAFDPNAATVDAITRAIEQAGYRVEGIDV